MALLPFRVMWALAGHPLLRVGVDPGPRPGIAILASLPGPGSRLGPGPHVLLADFQATDEEQALAYLLGVLVAAGPGQMIVRIGHGAPLPRNRLANGVLRAAATLWNNGMDMETGPHDGPGSIGPGSGLGPGSRGDTRRVKDSGTDPACLPDGDPGPGIGSDPGTDDAGECPDPPAGAAHGHEVSMAAVAVEIVDETGSSSGTRKESNLAAAARIARIPGYRLRKPLRSHIKPSDIAKVQERSRRRTGGHRTLSAPLAEAVAAGQMSLEEALESEGFRGRVSPGE